jgi:hypothetical protein
MAGEKATLGRRLRIFAQREFRNEGSFHHEALSLQGVAADGECVLAFAGRHPSARHINQLAGPHFDRLIDT